MKRYLSILGVFALFLLVSTSAYAAIWSGTITGMPESSSVYWGDGINDIKMNWSTRTYNTGWFGGLDYYDATNSNVFIYSGLNNPTAINNAATFAYISGLNVGNIGDTAFFRNITGYYGAFAIDNIYPNPVGDVFPHTYLTGRWYFQDNKTGDFTGGGSLVPEPASLSLLGLGLLGLVFKRKKSK